MAGGKVGPMQVESSFERNHFADAPASAGAWSPMGFAAAGFFDAGCLVAGCLRGVGAAELLGVRVRHVVVPLVFGNALPPIDPV